MPVRMCVGCRKKAEKSELVRITAINGEFVEDAENIMPGRGAYVCRGGECLEKANKTGALKRALKIRNG